MPPKTKRKCLADILEDLPPEDFKKFKKQLLDRKKPKIPRTRVEGKDFLDLADVLVSTFTEDNAVKVAVELLEEIDCNGHAQQLLEMVNELSSNPGASVTPGASAVASGGNAMTDDEHFVNKCRSQLISRITNINPILDDLLQRKVIHPEAYNAIRALPTDEEKMRELCNRCLKAGTDCKDIFYQILEKHEGFIIQDLKKNK